MKSFVVLIFSITFIHVSYSQDTIRLKNGSAIEAKILEISSTSVKFFKFSQPEGPLRTLELYEITEINYKDGTSEKFDISVPVSKTTQTIERPARPYRDPIFKRGFYVDRIYGLTIQTSTILNYQINDQYPEGIFFQDRLNSSHFLAGIKIGNKWYFGENEKWRLGFQTTWLRVASFMGGQNSGLNVSLVNLGMCSIIKLNEKRAVEANLQFGPSIITNYNEGGGFCISLEGKYRIKKFAIGLDYQFVRTTVNQSFNGGEFSNILNNISLTAGFKF